MSPSKIAAILLIALGVVVLAYSGLTFRTPGKPIDLGPVHVATTDRHYVSPAVGALALIGGIVWLLAGSRKS